MQTDIGNNLTRAIELLTNNQVVAVPTETVYGLAGNATSPTAIQAIFKVKNRPSWNPLIVHVPHFQAVFPYISELPDKAKLLADAFWPGPLTLLLPGNGVLPGAVNNYLPKVAFRVPAHPVMQALLQQLPFPLAAPSANVYKRISPTTAAHVYKSLAGKIPYILDGGNCGYGIESTVVGFDTAGQPVVYRQGIITLQALEAVTGCPVLLPEKDAAKASPGMATVHYAPFTPLQLVLQAAPIAAEAPARSGFLCFSRPVQGHPLQHQFVLSTQGDLHEAAANLYRGLHYLDELNLDIIFAELLPDTGVGAAANDRLQRAAAMYQSQAATLITT